MIFIAKFGYTRMIGYSKAMNYLESLEHRLNQEDLEVRMSASEFRQFKKDAPMRNITLTDKMFVNLKGKFVPINKIDTFLVFTEIG